jgi:lysine 2,3-aminomutase
MEMTSNINILPYYVYQSDLVKGLEFFRTPLSRIIDLEKQLRGYMGGFVTPSFINDLAGGGGKRLVSSFENYDKKTGVSEFLSPALSSKTFFHYDPLHSLSNEYKLWWNENKIADKNDLSIMG